jgi:hypothetical protein
MNCVQAFGPPGPCFVDAAGKPVRGSLDLLPKSTASEGVLFHSLDAGSTPGAPRMLVRDLAPTMLVHQPPMRVSYRPDDEIATCRLQIDRLQVVAPDYTLLFYPLRVGELPPRTAWSNDYTVLTINHGTGGRDQIRFDRTQTDRRTRIVAESVAGQRVQPEQAQEH